MGVVLRPVVRRSVVWLAFSAAVGQLVCGVAYAQERDVAELEAALANIVSRAQARPTDPALSAELEQLIDEAEFARIRSPQQRFALTLAAILSQAAATRAHEYGRRATAIAGAGSFEWSVRLSSAMAAGDNDDAVLSLTTVAERWPQQIQRVGEEVVLNVFRTVHNSAGKADAEARLLRALFDAGFTRKYWGEPTEMWRELAVLLLERGDEEGARGVVKRIKAPESIVRMRADRRFDELRAAKPLVFDAATAMSGELARLRMEVAGAPDMIEPITALATALRMNDQCEHALELVEGAIARAAGRSAETRPYLDGGEQFPWLLDHRARLLECLGRWDDALRQRVQAAVLTERGGTNVSQAINLAALHLRLGRANDALAAVRALGPTSAYGKMQEQLVFVSAYRQLGDLERARAALEYMSEHREDALASYSSALLQMDQLDAAAALLIARLADPRQRADALYGAQDFIDAPRTTVSAEDAAAWAALVARPDVRAAIDRVGRIESYPFR